MFTSKTSGYFSNLAGSLNFFSMFNQYILNNKLFAGALFLLLFIGTQVKSQDYYWVAFSDKNNSAFSLSAPEEFLSGRAIQRRIDQNIAIDSLDLPVHSGYITQVVNLGSSFVHASKWLNGITVQTELDSFQFKALQLPFVTEVQLTKPAEANKSAADKFFEPVASIDDHLIIDSSYYGQSSIQVEQLNAHRLHENNYRGQGIHIAVLDGGYLNVDEYSAFDSLRAENRILGIKDFVNSGDDFFSTHYHGTSVLSCMAGLVPGELIGTAPKASYWLLRSEETDSEYIIEEDNWVVAAEFADSVGVDIINSSLGYYLFDDESMNHTYEDMDGSTTRVSIAADIAASKGMLVFASVGNEGNDPWKYLIAPADGDNVIAVGAVNDLGEPAFFTSYGPSSDGDVKPNVAALGRNTYLQRSDGSFDYSNGTSFAAPVMAGASACLWQANPEASAGQIKFAIEQSAHLYPQSDSLLGYGIPDMVSADQLLKLLLIPDFNVQNNWTVYPNPVQDFLVLQNFSDSVTGEISVSFYSVSGQLLSRKLKKTSGKIFLDNLQSLPAGLLILKIDTENSSETFKLSKIR